MKKIVIFLCSAAISSFSFGQNREITVSDANGFIEAIAKNTTIYLNPGDYNLGQIPDTETEYYTIYGGELLISYVDNLCIQGLDTTGVNLLANDEIAPSITFISCKNISLKNLSLGHEIKSATEGNVTFRFLLYFFESFEVTIDNCFLQGSGKLGIVTTPDNGLKVSNCSIEVAYYEQQ